ncbi:ATP-binding cassette domain-containing protein [Streptomyces sp. SID5474]|nr:ATP-binding cassette domain-containing protein [Streptomyces sp. SID5474]
MLRAEGLTRTYRLPRRSLWGPAGRRYALRGVDLELVEGDALGVVGESGAGKSTLIRLLLGLDRADAGTVHYRDREVRPGPARSLTWFRREVQIVLQDPMSSLDPRSRVRDIVAEPLECLRVEGDHDARVDEVLAAVGLDPQTRTRYPHEFSGGQRQRIAIARALAPDPRVLVADEPVSALDVSVRAQILDLLRDLTTRLGLSLILVSHDLGVVQHLCNNVLVLKSGEPLESGPSPQVLGNPQHPYTQALLSAIPTLPTHTPHPKPATLTKPAAPDSARPAFEAGKPGRRSTPPSTKGPAPPAQRARLRPPPVGTSEDPGPGRRPECAPREGPWPPTKPKSFISASTAKPERSASTPASPSWTRCAKRSA